MNVQETLASQIHELAHETWQGILIRHGNTLWVGPLEWDAAAELFAQTELSLDEFQEKFEHGNVDARVFRYTDAEKHNAITETIFSLEDRTPTTADLMNMSVMKLAQAIPELVLVDNQLALTGTLTALREQCPAIEVNTAISMPHVAH